LGGPKIDQTMIAYDLFKNLGFVEEHSFFLLGHHAFAEDFN